MYKASQRWRHVDQGWASDPRFKELRDQAALLKLTKGAGFIDLFGGDPVNYGLMNPMLPSALKEAIDNGMLMYTPPNVRHEFKEAVAKFEEEQRDVKYDLNNIIITCGVANALNVLHYSLFDEKNELITVSPTHYIIGPAGYLPYFSSKLIQSTASETEDWAPDLDDIKSKINEHTRAIMVVNPNNPLGNVYSEKDVKGICDIAAEFNVPIISDEIYGLITYDGVKSVSTASIAKDCVVFTISGLSKVFTGTGCRLGYICISDPNNLAEEVTATVRKVASLYGHATHSVSTLILTAATKVISSGLEASQNIIKEIGRRRDYSIKRLKEIPNIIFSIPKGAFYIFPKIEINKNKWKNEIDFLKELTSTENLALIPGSFFGKGGEDHLRLLFLPEISTQDEIYNRLERFIAKNA